MAKRKTSKASNFERTYRILEYLKKNSDSEHTMSQAKLRKVPELEEYLGDKQTFNRMIVQAAMTMNFDSDDVKCEKEWNIVFDEFKRQFGDDVKNDEGEDDEYEDSMKIRNLYYNHTFSYKEINSIIEGILASKTIDSKTANFLIDKIEKKLTSKYYKNGPKSICKIQEPELVNKENMRDNLLIIQKAIDNNVCISFRFNRYNHKKMLEPIRKEKNTVSPYYIVASGGRYYLLACNENSKASNKNMSIWRIDLMTAVEIPNRDNGLLNKGIPITPKNKVKNLPKEWSEDFHLSHINMSYDKPIRIRLKIKNSNNNENELNGNKVNYTFLHDWFGDTFKHIGKEKTDPFSDIVEVVCSPFGMVNWALQYSDVVEVIEPEHVRKQVVEKVENLIKKYMEG